MPRRKYTHVHQYHKTYPRAFGVGPLGTKRHQWECALPDCTHYLPSNMAEPIGKLSLCHQCFDAFTLDEESMKRDEPICATCANPFTQNSVSAADVDFERFEAKAYIMKTTGRDGDDITDVEIDRMVQVRRLHNKHP